jgi:histidine triad (HIT) family protein
MEHCIFCKIIKGDIPSIKLYEDDYVLAFLDISQTTKGHTLIIPKKHIENIYSLDEETTAKVFTVVPKLANALTRSFDALGMNIINNNNEIAGQTVFHYHVHLVPRYSNDDGFKVLYTNNMEQYSSDDLKEIGNQIISNI